MENVKVGDKLYWKLTGYTVTEPPKIIGNVYDVTCWDPTWYKTVKIIIDKDQFEKEFTHKPTKEY